MMSALHAVIGVRHTRNLTWYVKRSQKMKNYPGVWSLLSIQFPPDELLDPEDLGSVQILMEKMSRQRLGGVPLDVRRYLISGDSPDTPVRQHVFLHLYEIELLEEPSLNQDYYVDSAWLTPKEYERLSADQECGLCLRLWSDYAWMAGITDRPFVPRSEAS